MRASALRARCGDSQDLTRQLRRARSIGLVHMDEAVIHTVSFDLDPQVSGVAGGWGGGARGPISENLML